MAATRIVYAIFATFLTGSLLATAQQGPPPASQAAPSSERIQLNVVVDSKSGQPVTNLGQQDFTVLDNKSPRPITSFHVVTAAQQPVEVILFIDAVNTPYTLVASMRNSIEAFLKKNQGALAHPTTFAIFTDTGVQLDNTFSTNGVALSDALDRRVIGLRQITQSTQWNDVDRISLSNKAMHQIVVVASRLPGRKIILWISPGVPLASGPTFSTLSYKAQQEILSDAIYFSGELREKNITLYDVNPLGTSQATFDANYYQNFVKGVANPNDAQLADLSIQVLSTQSGGLTFVSDNNVQDQIAKCLQDADSWYRIEFDPTPGDKPNEYHHIEVKLDQPGLVARTFTGYYSNTTAVDLPR
jgi:VWFA-related protein